MTTEIEPDAVRERNSTPETDPDSVSLSIEDIDEYEQLGRHEGWDLRCVQLSAGQHAWQYRAVALPGMYVAFEDHGRSSTHITGTPPRGLLPIVLPLKIGRSLGYRGQTVKPGEAIIPWPDKEAEFAIDGGLRCAVIYLSEGTLRDIRRNVLGPDYVGSSTALRRGLVNGPATVALKACMARLFQNEISSVGSLIRSDYLGRYIDSQIALALSEDGGHANGNFRKNGDGRSACVRRARDFMEANRDKPLALKDLCAEVGVSLRTLNYAFHEHCIVPPAKFHALRRLNGARLELKEGHRAETTVTDIATNWGFWHFGRFSRAYRSQFGEMPSQTLARRPARVFMPLLRQANPVRSRERPCAPMPVS